MVTIEKMVLPILFKEGSYVDFYLSDGTSYTGEITLTGKYYIHIKESNDIIFSRLGIRDKEKFIEDIVGYKVSGTWPFVKTLNDLRKVLYELKAYNHDRIPEDRKVVINEDEEKIPFTLDVRRHKQTKLNFKL